MVPIADVLKEYLLADTSKQQQHNEPAQTGLVFAKDHTEAPPVTRRLPRFYHKKGTKSNVAKLLEKAKRAHFIAREREAVLSNEELDDLWLAFEKYGRDAPGNDKRISYSHFAQLRSLFSPKFAPFLQPSIYMHFVKDEDGAISAGQFFNYVLRKVSLMQARIDLSEYDSDQDGFITEEELQTYLEDLMPSLNLNTLTKSFHKFYLCTAARKFAFFLDPQRKGKLSIANMLLSPILTEVFELREPDLTKDMERANWFSAYSALRVYGQFLNLDTDKNGMLSRQELARYASGTMTDVFLDRIFQECPTFGGEMDYRSFLDFVLAIENIQTPEAMSYLFRMLDIAKQGYLDEFTILYFFKVSCQHQFTSFQSACDEVSPGCSNQDRGTWPRARAYSRR
ncbi:hypothetical protein BC832DRAFT_546471 [Gaertneriomyces semiglobifer]|nr:hypothetical protein BC832DRAFT_546471 [Gaertneriomyces semiglobifer]